MPFMITQACISCAACEPVCPNGGIRKDEETAIYVIDTDACTECVGFSIHQQCAVVCPMNCCILDPNHVGTEAVLFERAKALHAGSNNRPTLTAQTSHFRKAAAGKWWQRLFRQGKSNTPTEDVTEELEVGNWSREHAGS